VVTELVLKDYLAHLGWGSEYLSTDGKKARLGMRFGDSDGYLEPFKKHLREQLPPPRLYLSRALPPGAKLKFRYSLTQEKPTLGNVLFGLLLGLTVGTILNLVVSIRTRTNAWKGMDRSDWITWNRPVFGGNITGRPQGLSTDDFPYDQWLEVISYSSGDVILRGEGGALWRLTGVTFTYVDEIDVSIDKIPDPH
jgi:hypothetical protein